MADNVQIVLVRPEHPGNVGAVARVMANFSFKNLVLVDPPCNHLCEEAVNRSKHAKSILKKAVVVKSLADTPADWLVATSGKLGSSYNVPRIPLSPWQLSQKVHGSMHTRIAIVFGPESKGLSNKEIQLCDCFVSIPASNKYPILNLSHSVGILLYELFVSSVQADKEFIPIDKKDKEILHKSFKEALSVLHFSTKEKKETQVITWHRLIGKSFLTKREAFSLLGFFRKVKQLSEQRKN